MCTFLMGLDGCIIKTLFWCDNTTIKVFGGGA